MTESNKQTRLPDPNKAVQFQLDICDVGNIRKYSELVYTSSVTSGRMQAALNVL